MRRFTEHDREEIRKMFQLHDIRKSKVWQEAHETGIEKGIKKGREEGREEGKSMMEAEHVRKLVAKGLSVKEVAELLELPLGTVRRLAKNSSK
jgi:predicted transposase/invertase (TIGR01784 family)